MRIVFLEVGYGRPGGSGIHNESVTMFCIYKHRLRMVLPSIFTYIDYGGNNKAVSYYKIKTRIHKVRQGFTLSLNLSKFDKEPYNRKSIKLMLRFDKKKAVFYNRYKHLSGTFSIRNLRKEDYRNMTLNGSYPEIKIDGERYYFIDGQWYWLEGQQWLTLSVQRYGRAN